MELGFDEAAGKLAGCFLSRTEGDFEVNLAESLALNQPQHCTDDEDEDEDDNEVEFEHLFQLKNSIYCRAVLCVLFAAAFSGNIMVVTAAIKQLKHCERMNARLAEDETESVSYSRSCSHFISNTFLIL